MNRKILVNAIKIVESLDLNNKFENLPRDYLSHNR